MNKKLKIVLITIAAAIVLVIVAIVIASLVKPAEQTEVTPPPVVADTAAPSKEPEETPDETPEHVNTVTSTLAVGGDIVMHTGLNGEAAGDTGYDYVPIFGILKDFIANADYSVCSLVTTFSEGTNYTAYPLFKSPTDLATSIAEVGFNLVNTATSHCVDSYKDGIDYTLDTLDAAGLDHVGTYRTQEERDASGNRFMADINGINVAFLAYTCDTNNVPIAGFEYAASVCAVDYLSGGTEIDYDLMKGDLAAAKEAGADIVFVFMSWGTEFATQPTDQQYEIADFLFENGADIIIGGHCRVPQPMELRTVTDADGNERTGFICYSLGNMLSCQNDEYTDISALVNIQLTKDTDTGETWISDVSYKPIYMADLYDYGINDYGWHYRMVDLHAAINSYESGNPWDFITDEVYRDMKDALDAVHEFFGADLDSAVKDAGDTADAETTPAAETPADAAE